jgi:hypothetical protein
MGFVKIVEVKRIRNRQGARSLEVFVLDDGGE